MNIANRLTAWIVGCVLLGAPFVCAQDWPQWRGPNRDAKATGFTAPKTWPKELTQKWKVTVGDGASTPALVGSRLYVFSREDNKEVIRCLEAADGKEVWKDQYEAEGAKGAAKSFSGPRCSPTVAEGKVVTLGTNGTLSCLDAATGKVLWRNDDYKGSVPQFSASSSPIVVNGLCMAQVGGSSGAVIALDLASGKEKWKWTGDGAAYASPDLLTVGGAKVIIAEMDSSIVGLGATDGKVLWKTPFAKPARMDYNAASPMADGQTLFYGGTSRGITAVKLETKNEGLTAKELWSNKDNSPKFNTPVVKDGLLYGISDRNSAFCIDTRSGKTAWTASLGKADRRSGGFGSVVDAGPVLLALTPASQLIVFEPSGKEFKEVAKYKVANTPTYAYPIASGKRLFIKDMDSVILWTVE
jgi:outer membrane protein assembly factor BamB